MLVGNSFSPQDKAVTRGMLGHDFLAFYTAGSFVRDGRSRELYRLDSVRDFQRQISKASDLETGPSFGPWWNPPFYALAFEPLAKLLYPAALSAWRTINLLSLAAAVAILMAMVMRAEPSRWRAALLVPLLVVITMPFIQALSHGQNTMTSLLLLTATCALWRSKRGMLAGLVGGLLFFKPQLGLVIAGVMLLDLGIPAFIGLCITGVALLAINCIVLPGTLGDWLHQLPANVHWMQVERAYLWERHVTLKAFWRLLLQGRDAGEPTLLTTALTDLSIATFGLRLLIAVWRSRSLVAADPIHRDRLIAAAITTMPLLMPFYFDYDLMLLAVPATLLAIEQMKTTERADRRLVIAWIALVGWLYFNPPLATKSHVDVTVLLLGVVSWMSIERVNRAVGGARGLSVESTESPPLLRAA